ncbi:primosomal replication protein PriC [Thalassotalea sediminis]|uniref:primosomal replication protein PriC n=1 Tax=Thalassotalea sediminis TaxID=1759089 RepID=UPI002572B895|nr:primosomal replication protein PriC [Thalassotalea sediminis]
MSINATLARLTTIVEQLLLDAKAIDQKLQLKKSNQPYKERFLFSPPLFSTQAETFLPYALEVKRKVSHICKYMKLNAHSDFVYDELTTVEKQINALTTAYAANSRKLEIELQFKQKNRARYFKKAAKHIMQTSHDLHQKLAETHEFERRLMEMLELKQIELNRAPNSEQATLSQQVLALHQRLGRCRQAISKIERQIEMSEKR